VVQEVTITPEQQIAQAVQGQKDAQIALDNALKALEKNRDAPIEELLKLSQAASDAKVKLSQSGSRIKVAENAVKVAEWNKRAAALAPIQNRILASLTAEDKKIMAELQVEGFTATLNADTTKASSVKAFGEGVPKSSASPRIKSENGTTRSRKVYSLDGTNYNSREFVEAFGRDVSETRTATVLDDPSKGLSHFADEIAKKKGATITQ